MQVRLFSPQDVSQVAAVFDASVMGSQEYYSLTERLAWVQHKGGARSEAYWLAKLEDTTTFVAEADGKLVGFINLRLCPEHEFDCLVGEVDCLFVHPDYSRAGVATQLYLALLEAAKNRSVKRLTVEASYQARPFFEKQGFNLLRRNELRRYITPEDKMQDKAQVLVNFSLMLSLT
ncbi:GNAT family N-acetyltransferase [Shewanella acanthi]|uniref:GNAT family N-acetyltransferase n=1 Tax=Shewanella acanthi TaxID=2864212 RepID=UPI001C660342|nr:GNAT family N-acetyltransferase [Shewanella acanthi]MCH1931576.1 GNAT family N-acetyltransferase [Shewanella shenzhenensis]QYJ79827.1 GNAT family N-acetyltransferase [Shewanella acanthi]